MNHERLTRTRLRRLLLVALMLFASATTTAMTRPQLAEASVVFTAPTAVTTWQAGTVHEVAWRQVPGLPASPGGEVQLQLLNNGQLVTAIASKVDVTRGSVVWRIPANMMSSNHYQIRMIGTDASDWVYSSRFAIKGIDGVVQTPAATGASSLTGSP